MRRRRRAVALWNAVAWRPLLLLALLALALVGQHYRNEASTASLRQSLASERAEKQRVLRSYGQLSRILWTMGALNLSRPPYSSALLGGTGLPVWEDSDDAQQGEAGAAALFTVPSDRSCKAGAVGLARELFPPPRQITAWRPAPDKYLVALCSYGRLTNKLMCIQRYMAFAALLNRTLLVPRASLSNSPPGNSSSQSLDMALDLMHAQACVGPNRVLPLEGFLKKSGRRRLEVVIWQWVPEAAMSWDHIRAHLPQLVPVAPAAATSRPEGGSPSRPGEVMLAEEQRQARLQERQKRLRARFKEFERMRSQGRALLSAGQLQDPLQAAPDASAVLQTSPIAYQGVTVAQFLAAFGASEEEAISLGDVFLVTGTQSRDSIPSLYEGPSGPLELQPGCQLVLQPAQPIIQAAQEYVSSALGSRFAALHLRRTDFASHCRREGFNCWFPLRQLAECLVARLQQPQVASANISTLYLATDASPQEVAFFKEIVASLLPRRIAVVRLTRDSATHMSGVQRLREGSHVFLDNAQNLALLEKLVCTQAAIFWGSLRSTFSKDVLRMRLAQGRSHCLDDYLCGTMQPESVPMMRTLGYNTGPPRKDAVKQKPSILNLTM